MKLRNLLLILVLIMALTVSAVYAQETVTEAETAQETAPEAEPAQEESSGGFLKSLFGEGGPLADVLPAGTDIDTVISMAGEQLGKAESELGTVVSSLVDKVQSEGISFNMDSLMDYAVSFLTGVTGDGNFDFGQDLDAYMAMIGSIRAAEEQYYKDHNADMMDPAEIQFVSNCALFTEEHAEFADYSNKGTRTINYLTQLNFVRNEANWLVFVSGCSDVVMFTVKPDEAGNFSVVDAKFSEDGENYKPSIEAMLAETGAADPIEEIMNQIEFGRAMVAYDLEQFLINNPEYMAVEYSGEMRTAEGLNAMWSEELNTLFAEPEAEPAPAE